MIPRGDPNSFWLSTPFDDPVETADDPFGRERKIDLDAKPFAVKVVQHVQQPECTTITETIRHEIHRPRHVRRVRHCQCIGLVPLQAFARLNAQIQLQFAVDAPLDRTLCNRLSANGIDAFVVPLMALHIAQMQET